MRKYPLVFLMLLISACALNQPSRIVITATFLPPTPPQSTAVEPVHTIPTDPPSFNYTVQAGDTLNQIASDNGVTLDDLVSLNNIADPDNLSVGQVIMLPTPPRQQGSDFKIIPDSRLVRAPGSSQFDVAAFISQQPGYLSTAFDTIEGDVYTAAQVVQRIALEYSVDPRLLLALLEYKAHLISNRTPTQDEQDYPLGAPTTPTSDRKGLYLQLAWAADTLNAGYYGWNLRGLSSIEFTDKTRILFARTLNAGTVGVQYLLGQTTDYATWQQQVSASGLYATYVKLFGDPFAGALDPVVPDDLQQPPLTFPFPAGQTWYFTGGPHGGWDDGSAWSAVDFAPPDDLTNKTSSCFLSDYFATAVADGVIARTAEGTVILDLDGDEDESTGWTILYLHMSAQDRVTQGTHVKAGDKIGRPSCEGGVSTGTHVHIARRYNGEWIPVVCDSTCVVKRPTLVMSGWTFYDLPGQLYQGGALKGSQRIVADQGRNNPENQVTW
ncbi:MAG TPA: LysM peptidoglycan-binding domain-containing protein [Phototrophicaceae bacterium]|nr:LysM peptidoglycan-binding domain-containing protein [Phototrophicaceae bacterium]